ncbi:ATP-binding protein [Duganella guangzhouensis]|nr:ATP-binding protein [Duganella guangzhouensis]
MANYRDSDVQAMKFWEHMLKLGPSNTELTYMHGLMLLFLCSDDEYSGRSRLRRLPLLREENLPNKRAVFAWLAATSHHTYIGKFSHTFAATNAMFDINDQNGPDFALLTDWVLQQYELINHWVKDQSDGQLVHTFEYGHAQLVTSKSDLPREYFAAHLAANCMFHRAQTIGDLDTRIGHFAAAMSTQHKDLLFVGSSEATDIYTAMRLYMRGIPLTRVDRHQLIDRYTAHVPELDFLLLNPTPVNSVHFSWAQSNSSAGKTTTVIELIAFLLNTPLKFRSALAVVPQSDCTAKSHKAMIRYDLVNSGRIAAVIDFPHSASDTKRRYSAWLIVNDSEIRRSGRNGIMFIDAEPLSLLTADNDASVAATFIAALIADVFEDPLQFQLDLIDQLETKDPLLAKIFAREFSPGHHNAAGLSRFVSIAEVEQHDYALSAKTYLTAKPDGTWLKGVGRGELAEVMTDSNHRGKSMYIIGNNGEGKSLLLSEIASESVASKRHTVAISFGATDRFPINMQKDAGEFYQYMGARTSATAVDTKKAAINIGSVMLAIHASPPRSQTLKEILGLIGFSPIRYLISKNLKASQRGQDRLVSGVVSLESEDDDDLSLIHSLRNNPNQAKKYKLGLRRSNHDSILPFDELSSGEQQIIFLLAKMISQAEAGALLLVDEPEISLHVAWQQALPTLFRIIARTFEVDILVATHSPIIIASTEDSTDYCFTIRDRALWKLTNDDRRSVETALFEGFRTYTHNNREVHERCASLVAGYIDAANRDHEDSGAKVDTLEKLENMKEIIQKQRRFAADEDIEFDLSLVERARSAVEELSALASTDNTTQDQK